MNFKDIAVKYKYSTIKIKSKEEFILLLNKFKKDFGNELTDNYDNNTNFYLSNFNDYQPEILLRLFSEYSPQQKKVVYGYFLINNKQKKHFSHELTIIDCTNYFRKIKLKKINNKNLQL